MAEKKKKSDATNPEAEIVVEQDTHTNESDTGKVDTPSIDDLQAELTKLSAEKAELYDMYVRKHADFENYRKRMTKEKSESIQYANADLIEKMLDVLDNFERARKAAQDSGDLQTILGGVDMIEQSLTSLLASKGLSKLESVNQPFNPEQHLAIAMEETDTVTQSVVIEEFQPGYMLHNRLLRTAKVKVAMPLSNKESSAE